MPGFEITGVWMEEAGNIPADFTRLFRQAARNERKKLIRQNINLPIYHLTIFCLQFSPLYHKKVSDMMVYGTSITTSEQHLKMAEWALRYARRLKGERL